MAQNVDQSSSRRPLVAVYPGSFDPPTNGHLDIITRASRLVDHLIVAVAINSQKAPLFSTDERKAMLQSSTTSLAGIEIESFTGLLVDFVARHSARAIIRGIRSISDYEIENQMALANRRLCPEAETIFLMASEQNFLVSSRLVKEIASLGGDVSSFVPVAVKKLLQAKFSPQGKLEKNASHR